MTSNRCPECDHEPIPSNANYCPNCASPLETDTSPVTGRPTEERSPPTQAIQEKIKALALDEADVALSLTDTRTPDHPIIYANNAFLEMTGYSWEEVIGNNRRMLRGADTNPDTAEQIDQAVDRGHSTEVEILNYRKGETPFWSLVRIRPLSENGGDSRYTLDIQQDITDRRTRERELSRQRDLMLHALENTDSHTFEINLETQEVTRYGSFTNLFHMSPEEVPTLDQFVNRAVHPEDREAFHEFCRLLVEGDQEARTQVYRTNPETGPVRWIRNDGYRMKEEPPRIVGLAQDITEQKQAEQELRQVKNEYETVFTSAQDAIFLYDVVSEDSDLRFELRRTNPVLEAITGLSSNEVRGKTPGEFLDKDMVAKVVPHYRRCVEARETISYEEVLKLPAGTISWQVILSPVLTGGEVTQIVGVARDITEQKQQRRELEDQKEALQQLVKEKTTLLQEVHHRVRNNLQNIISMLSLTARNSSEASVVEALQQSKNRVYSVALVHQLLHDSENLATVSTAEYIQKLVGRIIDQLNSEQTIQTEFNISPSIQFDPDVLPSLGLIVNELVSNSIVHAFEESGGTVSISLQSRDNGYELVVQDDGQGMELQQLEEQTSLGLTLVKSLAEGQLNGTMDIASDGGTRVVITFPEP